MARSMTQAERITALETKVEQLTKDVQDMNQKLDDLLALRNKGVGAFWLASSLFGASLVGVLGLLISWFKG